MLPSESLLGGVEEIRKRQQEVVGCVSYESKGEGKVECEGRARATDRGALRLRALAMTQ